MEGLLGLAIGIGLFTLALLTLVMKRISEIDAKLDKHISESQEIRSNVHGLNVWKEEHVKAHDQRQREIDRRVEEVERQGRTD